ncbi:hypothetical protein BSLG_004112 [Batrachochytrium salamandrivorans]|nr:hypothetical protein BSLG_004112 [Batrachochytrium salamandrivorans]
MLGTPVSTPPKTAISRPVGTTRNNNTNTTGSLASNSAAVASHYNSRPEIGYEGRKQSVILQLKNFNNWVKAVLIARYTGSAHRGMTVLDMCCGKGGDLQKWKQQRVAEVVGLDIAAVSVDQARARYDQSARQFYKASFHAVDCFSPAVNDILQQKIFDLVSIQFSLHYSFETEQRARQAISNIASHLRSGGIFLGTVPNADLIYKRLMHVANQNAANSAEGPYTFGNSIYSITFETTTASLFGHKYRFMLADAIDDCPEYLINYITLKRLAAEFNMTPLMWKPFHNFYQDECISNMDLLERMRVFNDQGTISPDEWEAIGIYVAFAFQKN